MQLSDDRPDNYWSELGRMRTPPASASEGYAEMMRASRARRLRESILSEISDERRRQVMKWGSQTHPHKFAPSKNAALARTKHWLEVLEIARGYNDNSEVTDSWENILLEEVAEAFLENVVADDAGGCAPHRGDQNPEDTLYRRWRRRRTELLQAAAVIVAEIEDGDTKYGPS